MDWDAIGALAELLGAVAVVVSLGYLAVQIRSNTRQLRFVASQSVAESLDRAFDPIYSEFMLPIWHKGLRDPRSLSELEWDAFHGLMARQLHNLSSMAEAHSMDLLDLGRTSTLYRDFYRQIFETPGGKHWLSINSSIVESSVAEFLGRSS